MRILFLILAVGSTAAFSQTDKYKLTEKDTLITCGLVRRGDISGPFSELHSGEFENLVKAVFDTSPFPEQPYSIFRMTAPDPVRVGIHKYDELDYYTFFLYNLDSVMQVNVNARSKYALMAMIAHEAGHHVLHHFMNADQVSIPMQELQADYFAGWAMAKLNVPREEVTKGIEWVTQREEKSQHYPAGKTRVQTTLLGYDAGKEQADDGPLRRMAGDQPLSTAWLNKWGRIETPSNNKVALSGALLSRYPSLVADDQGKFYYTQEGKTYVVARAIPQKGQDHRYLIFDNLLNYWLVDRDSNIIDPGSNTIIGRAEFKKNLP